MNAPQQRLILTFENDSDCILKNVCTANGEHNELLIKCKYKILPSRSIVLLNNDIAYVDTAGIGYFYFPKSNKDAAKIKINKKQTFITGPNHPTDYERYAKVPFVYRDTLITNRNKLYWIKKDKYTKVVGYYVFK